MDHVDVDDVIVTVSVQVPCRGIRGYVNGNGIFDVFGGCISSVRFDAFDEGRIDFRGLEG